MRTIEHLSYDNWKHLGDHEDAGSLYTVLIALSDPTDYVGGKFGIEYTTASQRRKRFETKLERFSAMVIQSERQHGVRELGSPGRVTLATELWNHGDVPEGGWRPSGGAFEDYQETGVWDDASDSDDKYGGESRVAKEDEEKDEEEEDEKDEDEGEGEGEHENES